MMTSVPNIPFATPSPPPDSQMDGETGGARIYQPAPPSPPAPPKRGAFRRSCTCCLGAVLLAIVGIGLVFGAAYFLSGNARSEAKPFISSRVVEAFKKMDVESIKNISSPRLAKELDTPDDVAMVKLLQDKLGPLQTLDTEQPTFNVSFSNFKLLYSYQGAATFEKTSGTMRLLLLREDGGWTLDSFWIRSDALNEILPWASPKTDTQRTSSPEKSVVLKPTSTAGP